MNKVNFIALLLSLNCFASEIIFPSVLINYSGDEDYRTSKIPASLLKDADAIVRSQTIQFEVKDQNHAVEKVKKVVTILKKDERQYGQIILFYDKFSEIEELEGRIIDSEGNEVRELKKNEIKDFSAFSSFSLYEDNRAKQAELYYDKYPYTVEFSYEISYKGFLNWPTWYSQESINPVEKSRFEVVVPADNQLRFWSNQDSLKPSLLKNGSKKVYLWEAKNLPKLPKDAVGDDIEDVAAIVRIAPESFELEGYKGNMQSWKEFGLWFYNLCKGKDQLPESLINDIHALIRPDDDKYEKVRKLYNYMQSRTRYVSIQLGIGSWQPFDAKYVHEKGYGDCKALSNYMVSILKEAGIQAYRVLINNGDHRLPIVEEFPSNQFNHVVVCVPFVNDTLWLECTSQTSPVGQIGWGNENRSALMITDQGGILVQTPKSLPKQNTQFRYAKVNLNHLGDADADTKVIWNGNQQRFVRNSVFEATPEERENWIINSLGVPDARLQSLRLDGIETKSPEGKLLLNVKLPNYVSVSGNRLFFQPNLMEKRTSVPKDVSLRLSPVRFVYPYNDVDSIFYSIPEGYTLETIPPEVNLKSSFAAFSSKTVALSDSIIVFTRNLEVKDYSVPAKNYSEYRKFFSDVVKADRAQIVLVRKKN